MAISSLRVIGVANFSAICHGRCLCGSTGLNRFGLDIYNAPPPAPTSPPDAATNGLDATG